MTTNQPNQPVAAQPLNCPVCGQTGHVAAVHNQPPMQPMPMMVQPRRRSAMGTTLAILFAVFVVFPILFVGGCAMLGFAGLGAMSTP